MQFVETVEEAPAKLQSWNASDLLTYYDCTGLLHRRYERIPGTDCYLECE